MIMNNDTFEVTGNKLIVTDPCYERGTCGTSIVENAKSGTWVGELESNDGKGMWGERVAKLVVRHVDHNYDAGRWEYLNDIGVDSGQAGVFDEARYPTLAEGVDKHNASECPEFDYDNEGGFYFRACRATHSETDRNVHGGPIAEGFVSSSGYGDGSYAASIYRNAAGECTLVEIVFIDDSADEEEEDYGYGDEEDLDE